MQGAFSIRLCNEKGCFVVLIKIQHHQHENKHLHLLKVFDRSCEYAKKTDPIWVKRFQYFEGDDVLVV